MIPLRDFEFQRSSGVRCHSAILLGKGCAQRTELAPARGHYFRFARGPQKTMIKLRRAVNHPAPSDDRVHVCKIGRGEAGRVGGEHGEVRPGARANLARV